jgi:beta-glucosidase-like glycosyl hydrolase
MKALAHDYTVQDSAVQAIAAGCDGILICSGQHDQQAAALEALVHAIEEERLSISRVEDAIARQRKAKERFFVDGVIRRPLSAKALGQVIGREEYRVIADEMAQFA